MEAPLFHTLAITALVVLFVAKFYLSHKTIQFISSKIKVEEEPAAEEEKVQEVAPPKQGVDLEDYIQHIYESLNKITSDQEKNNKALQEVEQNFNNIVNDQALDYVKIQKDAEINFFKNRPITCAMVFLINLPMNILSFLQNLKYKYLVDKVTIQANYIRHEIRKIEENSKLTE